MGASSLPPYSRPGKQRLLRSGRGNRTELALWAAEGRPGPARCGGQAGPCVLRGGRRDPGGQGRPWPHLGLPGPA